LVLYNNGLAINNTSKNISMPNATSAAAVVMEEDGVTKYVSLLDKSRESTNVGIGDQIFGTVIRNGVVLEEHTRF
jgi:hypothetical protein